MKVRIKINVEELRRNYPSIILWLTPCVIIAYLCWGSDVEWTKILNYHDETFCIILFLMLVAYLCITITSLVGIGILIFQDATKTESTIEPPVANNAFPSDCEQIIESLEKKDKTEKVATAIVVKDYMMERNKTVCQNKLTPFIPNVRQVYDYPIESLKLMLSSYDIMKEYEKDDYYNFHLIQTILEKECVS